MTRFTIPMGHRERFIAEWQAARELASGEGGQPVEALLQRAAAVAPEDPEFARVLEQAAHWIRRLSTWMRRMTAAG